MAEEHHKYISLKDVLNSEHPKLDYLIDPNVESGDEHESDLVGNPNSSSASPPLMSLLAGSCSEEGKSKKDEAQKKKGGRARSCYLKHSRSDDPLVYEVKSDKEGSFDVLQDFSQEMKNFSWEERIAKPNVMFVDSDEEEGEKKKKK